MGIEAQHGSGHTDFDGQDIPDIEWNDVRDEEVNVVGRVNGTAFAVGVSGASFVGAGAKRVGGLDLNTEETVAVVEDEVVALGVSPGRLESADVFTATTGAF